MKYTLLLLSILISSVVWANKIKPNEKHPIPSMGVSTPTIAEIDAAMSAAEAAGRIVPITSAGMNIPNFMQELVSLPVTFRSVRSNWNYDVTVLSMDFTPGSSTLKVACKFYVPNSTIPIYFGADNIAVSAEHGFVGSLPILQESLQTAEAGGNYCEFPVPKFNNNLVMALDATTKLNFSCGSFLSFTIEGFVKAINSVETEDNAGNTTATPLTLNFNSTDIFDWQDIYLPVASVSSSFHGKTYKDLGFSFPASSKVWIDLSQYQNPSNLPSCASVQGNAWQGIYFESFGVRLPKLFLLRPGVSLSGVTGNNLFIDPTGLVGSLTAQNVFSLDQGITDNVNQFDMSLDNLSALYQCDGSVKVNMTGGIRLPTCSSAGVRTASTAKAGIAYNMNYDNASGAYSIATAPIIGSRTPQYSLLPLQTASGSTLALSVNSTGFSFQASTASTPTVTASPQSSTCAGGVLQLTASNCSQTIVWSNGATGATINISPVASTSSGSYTLPYTASCVDQNCINTASAPALITVYNTLPSPTISPATSALCTNESLTLTASTTLGQIEWQKPGESTWGVLVNNQVITPTFTTSGSPYLYKARTVLAGCPTPSAESIKSLTVNPTPEPPTLSSDKTSVCLGSSVVLSGNCTATFAWVTPLSGTTSPIKVTPSQAGNNIYEAQCTNSFGCVNTGNISISTFQPQISTMHRSPDKDVIVTADAKRYYDLWIDGCNGTVHWIDQWGNDTFTNNNGIQLKGVGVYNYQAYCVDNNGCTSSKTPVMRVEIKQTPIVTARAYPPNVLVGEGTQLYLEGAEQCNAVYWYSPWDGSIFNGTPYIDNLNENRRYRATCYYGKDGAGNDLTVESYVDIGVHDFTPPNIIAIASPQTIQEGEGTRLYLDHPELCTKGIIWTGPGIPMVLKDEQNPTNILTNTIYTASCYYGLSGKWVDASVTVYVNDTPTPVIEAKATNNADGTVTLWLDIKSGTCKNVLWWDTPGHYYTNLTLANVENGHKYIASCYYGVPEKPINSEVIISKAPCSVSDPSISIDKISIKKGESITVSVSCSSGTAFWTSPLGYTGTSTQTPKSNTTYSAKCVSSDGKCESVESSKEVIVTDADCTKPGAPTISADKTVITGTEQAILTASGCSGTVTWSTHDTGTSISVGLGTYTATCSNSCGSSEHSNAVSITNTNCPTPTSASIVPIVSEGGVARTLLDGSTIKLGQSITVNAVCSGNDVLTWNSPQGYNGGLYTPTAVGSYSFSCTCKNACGKTIESSFGINVIENCSTPTAPTITVPTTFHTSDIITVTASCPTNSKIQWNSPTGFNGGTYKPVNTTDFAAQCKSLDICGYESKEITQTVSFQASVCGTVPTPNVKPPVQSCGVVTLSVDNCSGTVNWRRVAWNIYGQEFTVELHSDNSWSFGAPRPSDYNLRVTCTDGSCTSAEAEPDIPYIPPIPTKPSISASKSICSGTTTTISASNCNYTYKWSTGDTGSTINVTPTLNTTYAVKCVNEGITNCNSENSDGCTISVLFPPNPPTISSDNYKLTSEKLTATLTASNCSGTITWSNGASGSTTIISGTGGDYTATCSNSCGNSNVSNKVTIDYCVSDWQKTSKSCGSGGVTMEDKNKCLPDRCCITYTARGTGLTVEHYDDRWSAVWTNCDGSPGGTPFLTGTDWKTFDALEGTFSCKNCVIK